MPDFEVTSPSGQKFKVTAPEGASQADIIGYAQKQIGAKKESFLSAFTGGVVKGLVGAGSSSEPQMPYESEEQFKGREATPQFLEEQFPTPDSLKGRIIQGIAAGTFSPANLLGPVRGVALAGRLASGATAGAGAELAGAVSKDNPVARLLGGVAGGLLPRAAVSAGGRVAGGFSPRADALPKSVRPERAGPVAGLRAAGIEPTAGDVLGSSFVRQLERQGDRLLGGGSYERIKTEVGETYTRAVSRAMGEDATRITPDIIRNARTRIGRVFERVATALPIVRTKNLSDELVKIEQDILTFGHTDEVHRRINALIQHVNNGFIDGAKTAEMNGTTYQSITRHGEALQRAIDDINPNIGYFAGRIRGALDDEMERTVDTAVKNAGPPGGPAQARAIGLAQAHHQLKEARRQWYNMMVISKSLAGPGESAAQHIVVPERLRANLTSGADNKMSYVAGRSDLGQLANAGTAIIEPLRSAGWHEHQASHLAATGLALLAGGPKIGGAVLAGPGLTGRAINSAMAQNMLKNQRAHRLLDQLAGVREIAARSGVISQSTRRPSQRQQQSGIVPTSALLGKKPGDYGGTDEE
jgi:surface antigen